MTRLSSRSIRATEMTGSLESSRHFRKQQKLQNFSVFSYFTEEKQAQLERATKCCFVHGCMIWSRRAEYKSIRIGKSFSMRKLFICYILPGISPLGDKPLLWDETGPSSESHRYARIEKDLEVYLVPFPHDEQECQILAQDAQTPHPI